MPELFYSDLDCFIWDIIIRLYYILCIWNKSRILCKLLMWGVYVNSSCIYYVYAKGLCKTSYCRCRLKVLIFHTFDLWNVMMNTKTVVLVLYEDNYADYFYRVLPICDTTREHPQVATRSTRPLRGLVQDL